MNRSPYLSAFRRWWTTVVVLAIVGAVVGYGATLLSRPSYSATAAVYFSPGYAVSAQDLNQSSTFVLSQMPSYVELAKSDSVLAPAVVDLGASRTTASLAGSLDVSNPQDSAIVEITASDASAAGAAKTANAVAARLSDAVKDLTPQVEAKSPLDPVVATRIASADAPRSPSSPNSLRNVLEGLLIGLVVGALVVLLRQAAYRRVATADALVAAVPAPLLGVVPRHVRRPGEPNLMSGEDMVHLATGVRGLILRGEGSRFIVTAATPREGTTTIAGGIGSSLARLGHDAIVVETNLRHPSLADVAGVPDTTGLSEVLTGGTPWSDAVRHSDALGVDVLVAGTVAGDPSALIASTAMTELVHELTARYEVVIIDAAAVDSTADASILAPVADGVILVADATSADDTDLADAAATIGSSGSRVVGTVLNKAPGHHKRRYPQRPDQQQAPVAAGQTTPTAPSSEPVPAEETVPTEEASSPVESAPEPEAVEDADIETPSDAPAPSSAGRTPRQKKTAGRS